MSRAAKVQKLDREADSNMSCQGVQPPPSAASQSGGDSDSDMYDASDEYMDDIRLLVQGLKVETAAEANVRSQLDDVKLELAAAYETRKNEREDLERQLVEARTAIDQCKDRARTKLARPDLVKLKVLISALKERDSQRL